MIDMLAAVERRLPLLLMDPLRWKGSLHEADPPRVERLWTIDEGVQILLHRIFPCEAHQALWHTHLWPVAARIVSGKYEMGVSFGKRPHGQLGARVTMLTGCTYEMLHPWDWHYVRAIERPVLAVLVTGDPYEEPLEAGCQPDQPLPLNLHSEVMECFRWHYPAM